MSFNAAVYGKLLTETLPRVISTEAEYARIEEHFNRLINRGEENLSPEETHLFELLANLLEDYEERALPLLASSTPLETLRFLMAENGLRQKDVVDIFESQSVASEVLSGKRGISKTHAKALAERFKLKADAFI